MIVLVTILMFALAVTHAQNIQVNTTEGLIVGQKALDGNYTSFYGIPYAGPTDGDNRFKAPTPPLSYPGLFHAMQSNVICAQPSERGLIGVENCLTLNIFTNDLITSKPVLVWLNAEEYTKSSSTPFTFKRLVDEGLVIVSMNFRLSIFGFLCLGVPDAPGNAGLKDVIQGLKWIKSNIEGFGGNPNNLILMGHASAAAIVDLVTMSPLAENLVHKAIALSGSALAPWAVAYDPVGYASLFGAKLSYTGKPPAELAKLLVSTDLNVLASALHGFNFYNNTPLFAPCIENSNLNGTALSAAPISLLRAGNFSDVPYIGGYVSLEGTMKAEEALYENWLDKMDANFTNFLPVDLDFGANATTEAKAISNFYFSGSPVSMSTIDDFLDYQGDTLVIVSTIRGIRERAASSKSEVRLLEFDFKGTLNSDWTYNEIPLRGVRHGAILNYIFDYDLRPIEETVMKSIVKRFAEFAYNGTATPPNSALWSPISSGSLFYLCYAGSVTPEQTLAFNEILKNNPHNTRMVLWNQLYSFYNTTPTSVSSANRVIELIYAVVFCVIVVRVF